MKNFPIKNETVTFVTFFVRYCKDLDLKVDEKLLEFFHEKGVLIPIARLDPGVAEMRKITLKDGREVYVNSCDLENFIKTNAYKAIDKETYYTNASATLGRTIQGDNMLEKYRMNGLLDHPSADKKFIPWETYKYSKTDYSKKRVLFKKHRKLLYSRDQVYILQWILKCRPYRFTFHNPPTRKLLEEIAEKTKEYIESFDRLALNGELQKRFQYFETYYQIYDFLVTFWKNVDERLDKNLKGSDVLKNKELEAEINAVKENLIEQKYRLKAKKMIDHYEFENIEKIREFFLHSGFKNHEDMKIYKENEFRLKLLKGNKRTAFLVDALRKIQVIEELYKMADVKKWASIEKIYGFRENIRYCEICGNIFFVTNGRQKNKKTCSEECSDELKKKNRRPKRRKQKKEV